MRNNIILIGFMGCGKTSVGSGLARQLGYTFCDTDCLIEEERHQSICEIFDVDGEEMFRIRETQLLERMQKNMKATILSTGGGLPLRECNVAILKKMGMIVYLRATADEIYNRLKDDTARPLLRGRNPKQKIRTLLVQRQPTYEEIADIIIDTDDLSVEEVISKIMFVKEELI